MITSERTDIKTRFAPDSNYRSIWLPNGQTYRFAIDPNKPVTELKYPEFYDIKITDTCAGGCPYCYQNSTPNAPHYTDVAGKLRRFFRSIPEDQRPYQIAYGGGEPTQSREFLEILETTKDAGIIPNFTTNGMWSGKNKEHRVEHIKYVRDLCGGVAVSTHPHLETFWKGATELYTAFGIRTNLHCIISDEKSIDAFLNTFEIYRSIIEFFVLLPYSNTGRADNRDIEWDYLVSCFPTENREKIAFGANFYPYLIRREIPVSISLYEPEIFSKYIDCKDNGYLYASSFSTEVLDSGLLS